MGFQKQKDINKNAENIIDDYMKYLAKTDSSPFVSFFSKKNFLLIKNHMLTKKYFFYCYNLYLSKLIKRKLLNEKYNINYTNYNIDNLDINLKYSFKALTKFDKSYNFKFQTFFNQWVKKMKTEYMKKIKDEKEIYLTDIFF